MKKGILSKVEQIALLRRFIPADQMHVILTGLRGEERDYFKEKIAEYSERITKMPKTGETEGQGDNALCHLHYFHGCCDWWITEKDVETADAPGQHQAFGFVNLGDPQNAEWGYISIVELIRNRVELDLHWTPKTIGEIRGKDDEELVVNPAPVETVFYTATASPGICEPTRVPAYVPPWRR
jgi:hypothetical protein